MREVETDHTAGYFQKIIHQRFVSLLAQVREVDFYGVAVTSKGSAHVEESKIHHM